MAESTCTVDGCEKQLGRWRARECEMHYYRMRRHGTYDKPPDRTCDLCDRRHFGRGLCQRHYIQKRRTDPARPRCIEPDCARAADTRSRCGYHYSLRHLPEVVERRRPRAAAASAKWRRENPERFALVRRENKHRRRAIERGGQVGKADYAAILVEHGMVCHICTEAIASLDDLHFDHVIPLAKGGPHAAENIRPAHAICNIRKSARLLA